MFVSAWSKMSVKSPMRQLVKVAKILAWLVSFGVMASATGGLLVGHTGAHLTERVLLTGHAGFHTHGRTQNARALVDLLDFGVEPCDRSVRGGRVDATQVD